jgi:hypothetical protein
VIVGARCSAPRLDGSTSIWWPLKQSHPLRAALGSSRETRAIGGFWVSDLVEVGGGKLLSDR